MSTDAQLPTLGEMVESAASFAGGFVAVLALPLGVVAFGALAAVALALVPIVAAAALLALAAAALAVPALLARAAVRRLTGGRS
ncbi:MAG TPA: hypothetical protein VIL49_03395 [Capillimicrobium sp.]